MPMKLAEAKTVFGRLMNRAKGRPLTAVERRMLQHASQTIRAAKRGKLSPNPKRMTSIRKFKKSQNIVRLGRALELRYQRRIGKHPGYYKHEITSSAGLFTVPEGWVFLKGRSVVISKSEPKRGRR